MGPNLVHTTLMLGVLAMMTACGGEPPAEASGSLDASSGNNRCTNVSVGEPAEATTSADLIVPVTVLGDTFKVRGSLVRAASCTAQSPCPLVVVVADRDVSPWPDFAPAAALLAGNAKVVVAIFNLPGTGPGGLASQGKQDFGGPYHVTAVKDVMRAAAKRSYVNPDKTGFLAMGFGLVATTTALKTFATSGLKKVQFLIDVEGIVDRCSASQAPQDLAKGIGPDHGPGPSNSACHLNDATTLAEVYPTGVEGVPSSILCAPGAWPITKTGKDCTDPWWSQREPATALKSLPVRYQRLQLLRDHRQPTPWSSRIAMAAVAQSTKCPYFGLNDMPPCQAPLSDAICAKLPAGQSCWLSGSWGNGLAPAPYAGSSWCEVTTEELFALVLPKYLQRMLDTQTYKNCN